MAQSLHKQWVSCCRPERAVSADAAHAIDNGLSLVVNLWGLVQRYFWYFFVNRCLLPFISLIILHFKARVLRRDLESHRHFVFAGGRDRMVGHFGASEVELTALPEELIARILLEHVD